MEFFVTYYRGGQFYSDFVIFPSWAAANRYWQQNSNCFFIETINSFVDNSYEQAA